MTDSIIEKTAEELETEREWSKYPVDDPERARLAAERWQQVVREVQAKAAAEGRIVYVSSERTK